MTSAFSWQNSVRLYPASFCTPRPNLPVTPGISWLPNFALQFPVMKRHLFLVLFLEGLADHHRTIQLQLQHWWLGHKLGLLWYWMVCLKRNSSTTFQTLLLTIRATPFLLRNSCPQLVIWNKFSHSRPFLVHGFPKCWYSLLPSPVWLLIYLDSWN